MRYRLHFFLTIFMFSSLFAAQDPWVMVDSIKGAAEIQRAGHTAWERASVSERLYNNDIIRVLNKSLVRIRWDKDNTIYVHANSQICINLRHDSIKNVFTNYTTVFFGAVFFIIKKSLPRTFTSESKVYTPTASIAIRGTSFSTAVDKTNGETRVAVLNGTTLVRNILKNQQIILSAGYKTDIRLMNDPVAPSALLLDEITQLKSWVPGIIIDQEMVEQNQSSRKDQLIITGKLDNKIVVMPFMNSSGYSGDWNLPATFMNEFAVKIKDFQRVQCEVIDSGTQDMDPVKIGIQRKAGFVIACELKKFEIIQKAEVNAAADRYREYAVASVCFTLQLIKISSRSVIFQNDFCEEQIGPNTKENSWQTISRMNLNLTDAQFRSSILGKTIDLALNRPLEEISRYLKQTEPGAEGK